MNNKPPQQFARELAEKCAKLIHGRNSGPLFERTVSDILRELNLEQLIADKESAIQWLKTVVYHLQRNQDYVTASDRYQLCIELNRFIDSAMKGTGQ